MELQLAGKVALVTGADRGTGAVIANTLAAEGVVVIVHGASEDSARAAAETMASAVPAWGDIATAAGCEELLLRLRAKAPEPTILVNNFGSAARGKWADTDESQWLDMYQRNVLSGVRLVQGLLPAMKSAGWGRVIALGTIGSHQPNAVMPHYYAAKGALATVNASLVQELSGTGVTVNTVSPGLIHTPELEAAYRLKAEKRGWGDSWAQILRHIVEQDFPNPLGRIAERQEIADLVAFLSSPRADFINGQNIRVDGGAVRYV